jgi:hypothetical protein
LRLKIGRRRAIALGAASLFLTALVVAYSQRGSIIVAAIMGRAPALPFDQLAAPAPPDYVRAEHWAARPETDDAGDLVPRGADPGDRQAEAEVDVFFVHPTTYFGKGSWNQSLDDATTNLITDIGVLPNEASVFNSCCRVFAPRYRQATLYSFASDSGDGQRALELAYEDVNAAFTHYLEVDSGGRPFILAAHSQGSWHVLRLLEERISNTPLHDRLVAAYVVGLAVPTDKFTRTLPDIPPCGSPSQVGCLVSWNTVAHDIADIDWYTAGTGIYYTDTQRWENNEGQSSNCPNPLSWSDHDQFVDARENLGGAHFEGMGTPSIDPGISDAQCVGGLLRIHDPPDRRYRSVMMGPGDYHAYDFDLFHMNVRLNAVERSEAYLASASR